MRTIGMAAFVFAAAAALISCTEEKSFLQGSFSNLGEDTIYVKMTFPAFQDSVAYDTLMVENGNFKWDFDLESPAELEMNLGQDRVMQRGRWQTPMTQKMMFYVQPGEKIMIEGVYDEEFLDFTLSGSPSLEIQSNHRAYMKTGMLRIKELVKARSQALANGVENADEAYVDSLYAAQSELAILISKPSLDYIRRHPKQNLAAYMLVNYPDRDSFLTYYEMLDPDVKQGVWKYRLTQMETSARRIAQIKDNAARLVTGSTAPDFRLLDIQGNEVRLSDFSDKFVVIDFWGTWCPWCIKGFPKMKEYYGKVGSKVVFLGVACRDRHDKVSELVRQEKIKWINMMNGTGQEDVAFVYGVSGYPTKILLEPGLKVKGRYLGETPEFYKDLDAIIRK